MSTLSGGRGGRGFGGFPYRSSHQQGTDGTGGIRGRRRRRYPPRTRKTSPSLLCAADIVIPPDQRVRLIGRGGSVIQQLRESTRATIFVPNNDNNARRTVDKRPVRVKAESVASLLHACWKIVHLGLNTGETSSCKVRIPSNAKNLCGRVERNSRFFASGQTMSVYCVESFLDAEEVDTIVDNEKFSSNTNAQHETVYLQEHHHPSTLIFVYGQEPETLFRALQEATVMLWKKECLSDIRPTTSTLPTGALTVGTYNLLHPHYAIKYREPAGVTKSSGESNWILRAPAIARILLEANLDLYLLQEVEPDGLLTLSEVTNAYHVIQYVHPSREAADSIAILARRDRFTVERQDMLPYMSKGHHDQQYMCAATALIQDNITNLRYLVASTHFYKKKCHQPDKALLEHFETRRNDCDTIIWGGDCNDEYKRSIPSGYSCVRQGHRCTRGEKRIDWIFFSPDCKAWRSDVSEAFADATKRDLEPTGLLPSDHVGEAITLNPLETL